MSEEATTISATNYDLGVALEMIPPPSGPPDQGGYIPSSTGSWDDLGKPLAFILLVFLIGFADTAFDDRAKDRVEREWLLQQEAR